MPRKNTRTGASGARTTKSARWNYTPPEDIVAAAQLVRKGKVISLALNFDQHGPQGGKTKYPPLGRINPLHMMLRTGTDAYSGVLDKRGIRAADDSSCCRCNPALSGTGSATSFTKTICGTVTTAGVSSTAPQKCGIEKTKHKMVGRGVFLDVPRALGLE